KLHEKRFEDNIKAKIELLLTAKAEEVDLIFNELLELDKNLMANYNVNLSDQDKGSISRKKLAIKRSTKQKAKANSTKKQNNKKQRISKVIDLTDDISQEFHDSESKESGMTMMEQLEYEKRKLIIEE
ncbi:21034_t:CDS:2, partial [Racocetra persica]